MCSSDLTRFLSGRIRRFASHAWVAGMYQYEYVRRLGFPRDRILTGLYTADNHRGESKRTDGSAGRAGKPKTLLFVGRLLELKGVRELVSSFRELEADRPAWKLRLIGEGPLRSQLEQVSPRIEVPGFMQPGALQEEFAAASVFCLPSYIDHWGVVIHEACCAGLPVVATTTCGAITALVHHGYNGYRCEPKSVSSLREALVRVMDLPEETRLLFGERSRELSRQFTPDLWVSKVLSTL